MSRTARAWRTFASRKTLPSWRAPLGHFHQFPLDLTPGKWLGHFACAESYEHLIRPNMFEVQQLKEVNNARAQNFSIPAIVAALIGVGAVEIAQADAEEAIYKPSLPSEAFASFADMEETARKERNQIEELLRSKGMNYGFYPRFSVAVKDQKVAIKFQVPPSSEVPRLIANLVSHLGVKVEEQGGGSDMLLHAWDSGDTWQLTLTLPKNQEEPVGNTKQCRDTSESEGNLCIFIRNSSTTKRKTEIEFIKQGNLSSYEREAFVSALQVAAGRLAEDKDFEQKQRGGTVQNSSVVSNLEAIGVRIYGLDEPHLNSSNDGISWENIAGYDEQKREIEDMILLALHRPDVYDDIATKTRTKFESNRPRAVLFEGPPGTGKTSCARIIANQAGVPLLYVPLEVVLSKYYGESERLLGKVFTLANEFPDGAIIFLDEVDSFAATRDSEMHEATRRILSVLLRQIDGFEQDKKVVVIAATNRKQDLDPALISRFDSMITFGLPDKRSRGEIAAQYAKHLTKSELDEFATVTEEMSGRDIRDVCQQAERSWASKIIRGIVSEDGEQGILPPLPEYIESAMHRQKIMVSISEQKEQDSMWKKFRLAL